MIIRQTTTIVFEYPQDYLQEQEWCKTKEDRWIHKGTDTLCSIYENKISYSIGQPNNSEETNNSTISKMEQVDKDINVRSKDEPQTVCKMPYEDCEDCETHLKAQYGDCNKCKWYGDKQVCGRCRSKNLYAPKDEPQTDCAWR